MFIAFMLLHILLCDEVLLYFIVRVEVIEIQIGLEFRKDLKIKKVFPIGGSRVRHTKDCIRFEVWPVRVHDDVI
jgi:hypothetical protein